MGRSNPTTKPDSIQRTTSSGSQGRFSVALGTPNVNVALSLNEDEMDFCKVSMVDSWLNSQPQPKQQAKVVLFSEKHRGSGM
eukprot:CAMPEP_0196739620 /NCGR_PEP_ID=MMETSP1091-20130531/24389_1 /TAXON_ID=302021 /ORGANISM="Rhodomonas sp., Strain CCMP768" /LENGTH=81 /DNA_ID=CAMNT_0042084271 /DNA_START=10 /DNA_END=255 /DNA_ORIENTATION=+